MATRKRKCLSLETKINIITAIREKGQSNSSIASQYGLSSSSISTILKMEDSLKGQWESNGSGQRKRQRVGRYDQIDQALMMWFTEIRDNHNVPISGNLLKTKAKHFATQLGIGDFTASNGWLDRFKKRNNIVYKSISGESASVDSDTVSDFKEKIKSVISVYDPADVYNVDETGLFFKSMCNKTFAFKGEACHGGKKSKDRVTVLLGANMDGSHKLKPVLIGKYKNPRCMKNTQRQDLPVFYENSKNAWMTTEIFGDFLKRFDKSVGKENRKVLLLLDNCSAHGKSNLRLENVRLHYLPPNTTSVIQPLDQGVIRSFKSYYHSRLAERSIVKIEAKSDFQKVDIMEAIDICHYAWKKVTRDTIANCFRKGGFVQSPPPEMIPSDAVAGTTPAEPMEVPEEAQPNDTWNMLASHLGVDMTLADYIDLESTLTTSSLRTDEEFLAASGDPKDSDNEGHSDVPEEEEDSVHPKLSPAQMYEMLRDIRHNMMTQSSLSEEETTSFHVIEDAIIRGTIKRCEKQKKISDFFV